jgi:putative mRNA 3-end processing factor
VCVHREYNKGPNLTPQTSGLHLVALYTAGYVVNIIFDRGVYLPDQDLWLDSLRKRDWGYISHAHMDHVAAHQRPILTPGTKTLLSHLLQKSDPCTLEYGQLMETPGYTLTLYPAGHCLGSAQVLVHSKNSGERILYTGDLKLRPNPTTRAAEPVACDTLIIEATFGEPRYVFPPQEQVLEDFFHFLSNWLGKGLTPVVLAYRVGKSQELLHHLLARGFRVALEQSIYEMARRYEEAGVDFPGPFRSYEDPPNAEEVLIFPPGKKSWAELGGLRSVRRMAMSGWALGGGWGLRADQSLPFSDHPGFPELVDYVKIVGARRVYTVNGSPYLASHLQTLGYDAKHLERTKRGTQLKLM